MSIAEAVAPLCGDGFLLPDPDDPTFLLEAFPSFDEPGSHGVLGDYHMGDDALFGVDVDLGFPSDQVSNVSLMGHLEETTASSTTSSIAIAPGVPVDFPHVLPLRVVAQSVSSLATNTASPFEPDCLYWPSAAYGQPKFRLIENFGKAGRYVGDSYGDGRYFEQGADRSCSDHCHCRRLRPHSDDFAFIAWKEPDSLSIEFCDLDLAQAVLGIVGPSTRRPDSQSAYNLAFDGLAVLAKCAGLKTPPPDACPSVTSWLLLVDGFLADGDVFKSFGFENLHAEYNLSLEQWETFRQRQAEIDIARIEDQFCIPDEEHDVDEGEPMKADSQHRDKVLLGQESLSIEAPRKDDKAAAHPLATDGAKFNQAETNASLWEAAEYGWDGRCLLLLAHGADFNAADEYDWTPLQLAARYGHEGIVRLLLDRGATVNHADNGGLTPLHLSTKYGHEGIVRLLLDHGAMVNLTDNDGWTPLQLAARYGHEGIVRLLLDHGATVDIANNKGWTPLQLPVRYGHEGIVRLLLDRGATVDLANYKGWTALHIAAEYGHNGIIHLLFQHGTSVNRSLEKLGWTSLHLAAQDNRVETLWLLIQNGADHRMPGFWTVTTNQKVRRALRVQFQRLKKLKKTSDLLQDASRDKAMGAAKPKFVRQCKAVLELVQPDHSFEKLRAHFVSTEKAWQRGFATMRGISKGQVPTDLADVVALLCMCRAFSEVQDLYTYSDHTRRFGDDLGRWRFLFDGNDAELYKKLVLGLWGSDVELGPSLPCGSVDEGFRQYAQSLVSRLVQGMSELFGDGVAGDFGLEQSQSRWRARQRECRTDLGAPAPSEPEPPDEAPKEDPDPGGSLTYSGNHFPPPWVEPWVEPWEEQKFVLVVTGAIFLALLIFLDWLRGGDNGSQTTGIASLGRLIPTLVGGAAKLLLGGCQTTEACWNTSPMDLTYHDNWPQSSTDLITMFGVGHDSAVTLTPSTILSNSPDTDSPAQNPDLDSAVHTESPSISPSATLTSVFYGSPAGRTEENGGTARPTYCHECRREYSAHFNYRRHLREKHEKKKFECQECGKLFTRRDFARSGSHACRGRRGVQDPGRVARVAARTA